MSVSIQHCTDEQRPFSSLFCSLGSVIKALPYRNIILLVMVMHQLGSDFYFIMLLFTVLFLLTLSSTKKLEALKNNIGIVKNS